MNTFSKEELQTNKTSRKKFIYNKNSKKSKNKEKASKLIKNFNKNIIKSDIKEKNSVNKNISNKPINSIIKKFIVDNNKKIFCRNQGYFNLFKKDKNFEINNYLKKTNKNCFSEKKISSYKNSENKTIINLETFYTKTLNNYRNSFSPFFNKDPYFKLKFNNKENNNQILNSIKNENDNSIKNNNTISIKKFKSFEKDKIDKIRGIKEKRINCYINKINKKKNSNQKRLHTDNNINNNLRFLKFNKNNKSPIISYKNKKPTLIREKSNKYINTENKNHESPKEFRDILNYRNIINKNLLKSQFKIPKNPINNNTGNKNNNKILDKKENNNIKNIEFKIINNLMDLEPFDLNCFFYLPKKIIRTKILNNLEKLKCKNKQINPNKYIISFKENENIYEFNLPNNYSGIIKFKKIKGINKIYINDIRSLISNIS